jgi:ADP-ribose pyrophosphatase YjhB (NUDIX family)
MMLSTTDSTSFGDYIEDGYKPAQIFLDRDTYAKALDTLVVACVDIAPVYKGKVLLGKRTRHPQADWFIFGGRMHAGEGVGDSAKRLMKTEMGLTVAEERLTFLTTFSAAWAKRAHAPIDNGTHTTSFTLAIELREEEVERINLNDEYSEYKFVDPKTLINDQSYHPALGQCAKAVFIIPVYNEAQVIESVVNSVLKHYSNVVCVNDGSRDTSSDQILKTRAYLIEHPINMGQGAALQTGIEFARLLPGVKYFVTFDADGQHRLEDVQSMLRDMKKGDYDIILGSRFLGKAVGISRSKFIVLKLAILFSNFTSGVKLTDTHNGLRVFNRRVAEEIQITIPDMAHASEILEIIAQNRYRYKEAPVTIEYTDYSRSKGQSLINAVNIGFDTLLRKLTK